MKIFQRKFLVFLAILSITTTVSVAQNQDCINGKRPNGEDCSNAILTAVPFLRINPDSRAAGMGDVGLATSTDPSAMYFNASKLAFTDNTFDIKATYVPWLRALNINDVYLLQLSSYYKLDELQTLGADLRFFSLGDIQFTDETGAATSKGKPREFALSLAYARKLSDNFSVGLTGRYFYSNLAAGQTVQSVQIKPANGGSVDFSMTYKDELPVAQGADLTLGLAITNVGTKISYTNSNRKDYIPTNLGLGGGFNMNLDEFNQLGFFLDFNKLLVPTPIRGVDNDGSGVDDYLEYSSIGGIFKSFSDAPGGFSEELSEFMVSVGLEYWYDKQFAVRTGYFFEDKSKGARNYLTIGLGLKYQVFGLDISYLIPTSNARSPLDNTLRFSLAYTFNNSPQS